MDRAGIKTFLISALVLFTSLLSADFPCAFTGDGDQELSSGISTSGQETSSGNPGRAFKARLGAKPNAGIGFQRRTRDPRSAGHKKCQGFSFRLPWALGLFEHPKTDSSVSDTLLFAKERRRTLGVFNLPPPKAGLAT
jgi:hypothetical protein